MVVEANGEEEAVTAEEVTKSQIYLLYFYYSVGDDTHEILMSIISCNCEPRSNGRKQGNWICIFPTAAVLKIIQELES